MSSATCPGWLLKLSTVFHHSYCYRLPRDYVVTVGGGAFSNLASKSDVIRSDSFFVMYHRRIE